MLLEHTFAPITFQIGFVAAPLDDVVAQYVRWQHWLLRLVRRRRIDGPLAEKLRALLPMDDAGQRMLFTSTASRWTALFDSRAGGGKSAAAAAVLSERLDTGGIAIQDIPNTFDRSKPIGARGMWGATSISAFGRTESGVWGDIRAVSSRNDASGWKYFHMGTPWPFEDPALRRFDSDRLLEYCKQLDLRLDEPAFFDGPAIITRSRLFGLAGSKSITLDEARYESGG